MKEYLKKVMMRNMQAQRGQTSLIIVLVIGMAATLLSIGFSDLAVRQAKIGALNQSADKAYDAAQAGIEDVLLHLRQSGSYGDPNATLSSANFSMEGARYDATTTATAVDERTVTSTGKYGGSVKTIEITVLNSDQGTGFLSAVQTGNGGFEMEQGTKICTGNGTTCTGNTTVYSNADIKGEKIDSSCTAVSSSKIIGSATAVGTITKLGSSGEGPCVTLDASASSMIYCRVVGKRASKEALSPPNCTGGPFTHLTANPPVIDLPEFDEEYWRTQATNSAFGGGTYTGSCEIGGSPDCSSGSPNYRIGPKKIVGNLTIKSNTNPEFAGPLWITGNLTVESNNNIDLDPAFTETGTVIMADGTVSTGSNVQYPDVGLAIVLVVSTKNYAPGYDCDTPAIEVNSNVNSVIFYALRGCVNIRSNSSFYGAVVGQKVHLSNNAIFYYNSLFKDAVFGVSAGGGWIIKSWRNID